MKGKSGLVWSIAMMVLLVGCVPSPYRQTVSVPASVFNSPPPPEAKLMWRRAETALKTGNTSAAIDTWRDLARNYPLNAVAPSALHEVGLLYQSQDRSRQALEMFDFILRNYPQWNELPKTRGARLAVLYDMGNEHQVMQEAPREWGALSGYPGLQVRLARMMMRLHQRRGETAEALSWLDKGFSKARTDEQKKALAEAASSFLQTMDKSTVTRLMENPSSEGATIYLEYRLAQIDLDAGRTEEARQRLVDLLSAHPSHPFLPQIREALRGVGGESSVEAQPNRLGCLVPLNGPYAPYGQKIVRGLSLRVNEWNQAHPEDPVTLIAKDTQADPELALQGLKTLIEKERVFAVVGPLSRHCARKIAAEFGPWGIPVLALAREEEATSSNPFVFNVFLDEHDMLTALVRYCMEASGYTSFATLYPQDRAGSRLSDVFSSVVSENGGALLANVAYNPDVTDFKEPIGELMQTARKHPDAAVGVENPVQALFIPDQAQTAALIAPQLLYHNLVGLTLLGANLWAEVNLAKVGDVYMDGALFVTPFHKDVDTRRVQDFTDRFQNLYGAPPSYLEAQAYDALGLVLLARNRLPSSALRPEALLDQILEIQDYEGVAGTYSFFPDGSLERTYMVLQISNGQIVQRRPEPRRPEPVSEPPPWQPSESETDTDSQDWDSETPGEDSEDFQEPVYRPSFKAALTFR